jgi:two-component system response regulator LytT
MVCYQRKTFIILFSKSGRGGENMRIAVCDDEELFRIEFKNVLDKALVNVDYDIDTFSDGSSLYEAFLKEPFDLVFLDIEMPGIDGITLAKRLRAISENVHIVFLTSHIEYALEGYEVNALRYLVKPVDMNKLGEVLKYVQDKKNNSRQIMIREDGEDIVIDISDIIYMESMDKNVRIVTSKREYVTRYNISDYEEELKNSGFLRIHRGYLISLSKVKKIVKNDVVMDGDISLPVSRSNLKVLKDALYAYVEGTAF